jgi:hypothetical protein
MALSVPFGIVMAVKLIVAGSLSLFVWAAARFCIRMGVPSVWIWMLLVLPYGVAFQWGFLYFIVAAPLGFLFLVCRNPRRRMVALPVFCPYSDRWILLRCCNAIAGRSVGGLAGLVAAMSAVAHHLAVDHTLVGRQPVEYTICR